MALHVHRGTRADLLAEDLAAILAVPPHDPFAPEIVIVPARGVERWLTQRLSHRLGALHGDDGVCAGVQFLSPNSLVTLLLGTDRDDPWLPDQLLWPLLSTIDTSLDEEWAHSLAAHLGHHQDGAAGRLRAGRRYSVARRLAGLFHGYAVQRPNLLLAWETGPVGDSWGDGAGGVLPADLAWQPHLWRALTRVVPGPTPVARHAATVSALRDGSQVGVLPARLSLFGHTRLARTELDLLDALGQHREVHLFLPHPSPRLWDELADEIAVSGPVPRSQDRTVLSVQHPLLASLGRDIREVQRALQATTASTSLALGATPPEAPHTWLQWLQSDVRLDRQPSLLEARQRGINPHDNTIQVHACHGPARQVEVLREALLGLLADDPSLEPRSILVMCPDIESYAPLIHAAFGLADISFEGPVHPGHLLRVQLADRALVETNPLIGVATRLLELAGGRITASDVLHVAAAEPVRRRFGLTADDLERIATWVDQAAIRWGLDGEHRAHFALADELANTWRFGLDRLLVGVTRAAQDDRSYAWSLPIDDVDSGSIDLVGTVVELVDRLAAFREAIEVASTVSDWVSALGAALRTLTEIPLTDAWQRAELDRELATVLDRSGGDLRLSHSDLRSLMAHRLGGRPTRANFRTGSLTVCTMVPMRSVPHRVIALLGLDDGVFPRSGNPDGDDVLARRPMTGERDARSEDRQLLLDAILAAQETLIITYTGFDPRTGASRPPAVPLGELIDAARGTAALEPPTDGHLIPPTRRHPLQSFDVANLRGGEPTPPFSFDPHALPAARVLRATLSAQPAPKAGAALSVEAAPDARAGAAEPAPAARERGGRFPRAGLALPALLPERDGRDVSIEDLQSFYANPTRAFLRDRLDVSSPLEYAPRPDGIPIALDGLATWQIGERLLRQRLAGAPIAAIERAERQRGELPPAALGSLVLREVGPRAEAIATSAQRLLPEVFAGPARSVDIDVPLGGGRRLTGTVDRVRGQAFASTTYSSLSGRHRLEAWIALLALTVGTPTRAGPWTAHALGRYGRSATAMSLGSIDVAAARTFLTDLIELRDLGLRLPLAFAPKSSYEYAKVMVATRGRREGLALAQARKTWEHHHDNGDPSVALLYGPTPRLDIWLGPPSPGEVCDLVDTDQAPPSRFGHTALRVWRPVLMAESVR